MRYVSEIIGKPLISLYEGEKFGYITDILTNKNFTKLSWLIIENTFDTVKTLKAVKILNVYSIGLDAVMIYNGDKVFDCSFAADAKKVLGSEVYTAEGELAGKITDIKIENNSVSSFILENGGEIDSEKILTATDNTVIIYKDKKIKVPPPRLNKISKNTVKQIEEAEFMHPRKITYMPVETEPKEESAAEPEKTIEKADIIPASPQKILSDFNFLIGRKTTADIYNADKVKIIKVNSLITTNVVDIARKNRMLIELTRNSKK